LSDSQKLIARADYHLLVVDDDDRIRSLLKRYLTREGYRVSAAADTVAARNLMTTLAFDCLILDIMMPGETGLEFTTALRAQSDVPIILLTAKGDAASRISGLKIGADDYLPKPFEPEELVLRIDAVLRRGATERAAQSVRFGEFEFDIARQVLTRGGQTVRLTTGETGLLTTLSRRAGTVVQRYALAEALGAGSDRAVDVQMTRLRKKIEAEPAEPNYLMTVRGQGYRLLADPV